jgi:SAM-dependent methyltransferase
MSIPPGSQRPLPTCWCGNTKLLDFSPDYFRCAACETLVVKDFPLADITRVHDEDKDLYGANYAQRHLNEDYGQPEFASRSRQDLTDRCLHWLQCLLEFKLPPTDLLELGSFHGAFVGLTQLAGFRARGLDLSPKLCGDAARRFAVDILCGPLEDQPLQPVSLDIIALFDVLEHLQEPAKLLRQARKLLRPDGILIIQTPAFPEGRSFEQLGRDQDPFLAMLIPEHLYLLSQRALTRALKEAGFAHYQFEPAAFPRYDMFLVASPNALKRLPKTEAENRLSASANGRYVLGLLDLFQKTRKLEQENVRLNEAVWRRDGELKHLNRQVQKSESRLAELDQQFQALNISARLEIEKSSQRVREAEAQIAQLNLFYGDQLTTKERLLGEAIEQNATISRAVKDREQRLEKLDRDVIVLNELIHSGELTKELQAKLRRTQRELSLSAKLLASPLPTQEGASSWRFVPMARWATADVKVVANFEVLECDANFVRVTGWAFSQEPGATLLPRPLLVSTNRRGIWIFDGAAVSRPDVAAAYSEAATSHCSTGFAFECLRQDFPTEAGPTLRVAFAQTSTGLFFTPELTLR